MEEENEEKLNLQFYNKILNNKITYIRKSNSKKENNHFHNRNSLNKIKKTNKIHFILTSINKNRFLKNKHRIKFQF